MEDERVFLKFIGSLKKKWLLGVAAVLGVALIFWGGSLSGKEGEKTSEATLSEAEGYRKRLEGEIQTLCQSVRGVGKAEVMVTMAQGERMASGGQAAVGVPAVCGVAVVCEGGGSPAIQAEVTALIESLLGIGSHRIYVGQMGK